MAKRENNQGFVLLITVITICAIATLIAVTLLVSGAWAIKSDVTLERFYLAKTYADACAETALKELRLDANYAGNFTVAMARGECRIESINLVGEIYTIRTAGISEDVVRKVEISARRLTVPDDAMAVDSWQEVASY